MYIYTECLQGKPSSLHLLLAILLLPLLSVAIYSFDAPDHGRDTLSILREHYKQVEEIDLDLYLPKLIHPITIPFVLPDIRSVNNFNTRLNMKDLLGSVKPGTRLAVIGRPGVGKYTLTRHITKQWAQGLALQQFNVFFHICLGRTAQSPITGLKSLLEEECHGLPQSDDPEIELSQVCETIKSTSGKGVLLVLDAFNEYQVLNEKKDFVLRLIKRLSLPNSAIILTSRPRGVDDVKMYFNEIVEVIGFSEADINTSFAHLDFSLQPVIGNYFEGNPNVKELCYLPLHMTMLIYIASVKEDVLSSIDSGTEIYTSFLYLTINRYNERHGLAPSSLDDCFNHSDTEFCNIFQRVCKLAFNATIQKKQTFDSSNFGDIETAIPSSILTLFNVKRVNKAQGSIDVFYFPHKTFQDFMSACHLILLRKTERRKMIEKYGNNANLRNLVWKFFSELAAWRKKKISLSFKN